MSKIVRATIAAAFVAMAPLALTGCPTGVGVIPGTDPGSVIPGTTAGGGTTTPGGSLPVANDPTSIGASCTRTTPSLTPQRGKAGLGSYSGLLIPGDYNGAYDSEAAVTAKFRDEETKGVNWTCMNKFYPDAIRAYYAINRR